MLNETNELSPEREKMTVTNSENIRRATRDLEKPREELQEMGNKQEKRPGSLRQKTRAINNREPRENKINRDLWLLLCAVSLLLENQ